MTESIEVGSPCIGVCAMDDATNLCHGCYRTLEEIRQWWDLDALSKQKVVDQAVIRQESMFD